MIFLPNLFHKNQTQGTYPRKFSYFVQRLQVAFDKTDYPNFEDVNVYFFKNERQSLIYLSLVEEKLSIS